MKEKKKMKKRKKKERKNVSLLLQLIKTKNWHLNVLRDNL